jgi:hypothetical protein
MFVLIAYFHFLPSLSITKYRKCSVKSGRQCTGYITEETADEMSDQGTLKRAKRLGPLASARARRSKSAAPAYTPFLATQQKTPMIGLNADVKNTTKTTNTTITSTSTAADRLSRFLLLFKLFCSQI